MAFTNTKLWTSYFKDPTWHMHTYIIYYSTLKNLKLIISMWYNFIKFKSNLLVTLFKHFLNMSHIQIILLNPLTVGLGYRDKNIEITSQKYTLGLLSISPKLKKKHYLKKAKQLYNQYENVSMSILSITIFFLLNLGMLELSHRF